MSSPSRPLLIAAGASGFLAVALGAFGAHALKAELAARGTTAQWETAVLYHLAHSVAVLALALAPADLARASGRIGTCWMVGIVLFSGSIYVLCLGGPSMLGPVTPMGGLALLAGWAGLVIAGLKRPPTIA
jgi:uncharacterized membrane protein YgdD (TMEM256/DUF423 family)